MTEAVKTLCAILKPRSDTVVRLPTDPPELQTGIISYKKKKKTAYA
jgi:hypothetical protein